MRSDPRPLVAHVMYRFDTGPIALGNDDLRWFREIRILAQAASDFVCEVYFDDELAATETLTAEPGDPFLAAILADRVRECSPKVPVFGQERQTSRNRKRGFPRDADARHGNRDAKGGLHLGKQRRAGLERKARILVHKSRKRFDRPADECLRVEGRPLKSGLRHLERFTRKLGA